MAHNIEDIEGVDQTYALKFQVYQIKTSIDLLEKGSSKKGRQQITEDIGISEYQILKMG